MNNVWLVACVAMCAATGVWAADDESARVDYVPRVSGDHARFDVRVRSEEGRRLRETALAQRADYDAAVAKLPEIQALDAKIADATAEQDRLALARKDVAEAHADQCALERDAWMDARDALLTLRDNPNARSVDLAAAQARADAAQKAFRHAMATMPAVQDLDGKIAATRATLGRLYIERRATEESHAGDLEAARAAMTASEKAYLEYVYGQP